MTDKPDHATYAVPVFVGIVRREGTVAEYDTTIASREQHYVALGDYLDAMACAKAAERERDEARALLSSLVAEAKAAGICKICGEWFYPVDFTGHDVGCPIATAAELLRVKEETP